MTARRVHVSGGKIPCFGRPTFMARWVASLGRVADSHLLVFVLCCNLYSWSPLCSSSSQLCVDSLKRIVSGGGINGDLSVLSQCSSTYKVHGSAHSLFPRTSIGSDGGWGNLGTQFMWTALDRR